jgi:hypothetical protein
MARTLCIGAQRSPHRPTGKGGSYSKRSMASACTTNNGRITISFHP